MAATVVLAYRGSAEVDGWLGSIDEARLSRCLSSARPSWLERRSSCIVRTTLRRRRRLSCVYGTTTRQATTAGPARARGGDHGRGLAPARDDRQARDGSAQPQDHAAAGLHHLYDGDAAA